jgi:hypothetical protein
LASLSSTLQLAKIAVNREIGFFMAATELQHLSVSPEKLWETRTYTYYSRYPAIKPTLSHHSRGYQLRHLGMYLRLITLGVIAVIMGGIVPILLSYELCFKRLLTVTCNDCQIVNSSPYFAFDYVLASALGILGFMMPIFVLYIFVKIMRNRMLRHDIFH